MENKDKLRQWRQTEFLAYTEWLNSYEWEWFVTLTLEDFDNYPKAERLLRDWTRRLCTEERIQIAYVYIYCENYGHAHIHVLMVGRNSIGDKTLADVSMTKWEKRWPCIAEIEIPESNNAVVKYLSLHLFKFKCSNYPNIEFYNRKLLKRYKKT